MPRQEQSASADNHRIITEKEAAKIRGVSADTLRRNSERGSKPTRVKLSKRRVGYWLDEVLAD
jgi:predicted DNA-binding transcriptional regulator AlpA